MRTFSNALLQSCLKHWWLILPLPLVLLETVLQGFHPFASPYLTILLGHQPIAVVETIALSTLRSALGYTLITALLAALFPNSKVGLSLFCIIYGASGMLRLVPIGNLPVLFFGAVVVAGVLVARIRISLPTHRTKVLGALLVCASILGFTRLDVNSPPTSFQVKSSSYSPSDSPSFVLLSFDSVPAEFFQLEVNGKQSTPLWNQHWKGRSDEFQTAYAVTNSTFTSWYSILSGKFPYETGVSSLYPNPREGRSSVNELLPVKLKKAGYRTAYVTDCATTSALKPEYGFDKLIQIDHGGLRSAQALIASSHPALGLFAKTVLGDTLFPELQTYGSRMYNPDKFASTVGALAHKLQKSGTPFLLAIHSCVTHRDVSKHRPSEGSPLEQNLPQLDSAKSSELLMALRIADKMAHDIFSQALTGNTWGFLFSDHGVRIEKRNGKELPYSHALGPPVNRSQYHVPLYAVPPSGTAARSWKHLVSLLDLYPTILHLAKLPAKASGQALGQASDHASGQASGKTLWDATDRKLILNSAVPDADPTNPDRFFTLLKEGTFTQDGDFFFSRDYLPEELALAMIDYPFRLVLTPSTAGLYHDLKDPQNQQNIISSQPDRARTMTASLCRVSPKLCLSPKIQIASSTTIH